MTLLIRSFHKTLVDLCFGQLFEFSDLSIFNITIIEFAQSWSWSDLILSEILSGMLDQVFITLIKHVERYFGGFSFHLHCSLFPVSPGFSPLRDTASLAIHFTLNSINFLRIS